ncbi:hypothetical protein [Pararcticibacter amylolyticus]|uniref:Beta-lactamase-inhibitor-like PepSY-like domain-containing protein n=1 Tax=Pararcticibacter amylolyticus TaxID=2173175 RepID=A0A2U2PA05_9SPHI|nr:hypothetical protein [Pararcticibacter amylolyticus]PWG78217.1 hypothetical protein DDR33_23425 [Pararcticibacter amylolyticus]
MKKLIYAAAFVLALSVKGYADDKNKTDNKESEVSYFASNNFLSKYQGATNVNWTVTSQFQKASFSLNGVKMAAFFDSNGDYIATTQYVGFDQLPGISKSRLNKYYKDYAVEEVVRYDFDGQEDSHLYLLTGKRNYNTIYFASLKGKNESIVVKVTPDGEVSYLKSL